MEKELIIRLDHLSKTYDDVKVLDDVSLDIRRGEFVTLLGPSGCGKTTILRLIAGFATPTSGCVYMEGEARSSTSTSSSTKSIWSSSWSSTTTSNRTGTSSRARSSSTATTSARWKGCITFRSLFARPVFVVNQWL